MIASRHSKKAAAFALLVALGFGPAAPPSIASELPIEAALTRCLAAPSSEFIDFGQDGASLITERSGPSLSKRDILKGNVRFSIPPASSGAIIRSAGPQSGVLLMADDAGDERYGLYYQAPTENTPPVLLSPPGARIAAPFTVPSSAATMFTSTSGSGPIWGVLEHQPGAPLRVLFQEAGAWQTIGASTDGQRILLQETFGLYDRVLYILDRPSGIKTPIFLGLRPLAVRGAAISPDGAYIYAILASAEQSGVLIRSEVSTGIITQLLETTWPLYSLTLSADGATIAALENQNGSTAVNTVPLSAPETATQTALSGWVANAALNRDGTRLGMTYVEPGAPSRAVMASLDDMDGAIPNGSACANAALTALTIARKSPVAEQATLPGFLIEPQRPAEGPRALLIAFHGGPEGQWRRTSHLELFALADVLDMAILLPNVAGSTGYGLRYAAADDGAQRAQVIEDLSLILDWAQADPRFDASKIAVFGASYGGYLALFAQSQFNDQLVGAISEVGISDLPSFLSETPLTRRSLRRAEYGDERDKGLIKNLKNLSPLTHVQNITKPVFLAHGINDARVPLNQSATLAMQLNTQGTPFTYKPITGEGHVIRDVKKRIELAKEKASFLDAIFAD